jgi:hypothetical protein
MTEGKCQREGIKNEKERERERKRKIGLMNVMVYLRFV